MVRGKLVDEGRLKRAVALMEPPDGLTLRAAAAEAGVAPSSLSRWVRRGIENRGRLGGKEPLLTHEEEVAMTVSMADAATRFLPWTIDDIRRAVQLIRSDGRVGRNRKVPLPSLQWCYRFLHRHGFVSRQSRVMPADRVSGTEPDKIRDFLAFLKALVDKRGYLSRNIWNMDETGLKFGVDKLRVWVPRGTKRVQHKAPVKTDNLTILCAASAVGESMAPVYIFKATSKKSMPLRWMMGDAVNGTTCDSSKGSFMTQEIFAKVARQFVALHKRPGEPCLVIIDQVSSHLGLEARQVFKDAGVDLVGLPPHSSSVLQPLDDKVFRTLKQHLRKILFSGAHHRGFLSLSKEDQVSITKPALVAALDPSVIVKGACVLCFWCGVGFSCLLIIRVPAHTQPHTCARSLLQLRHLAYQRRQGLGESRSRSTRRS